MGKAKAQVQTRRLRQINRGLRTRAFGQPLEDLPLGALRCDVILAAVDSRRTRMAINQAAWRLGVPWINAGMDADGLLARVQVFMPATRGAVPGVRVGPPRLRAGGADVSLPAR